MNQLLKVRDLCKTYIIRSNSNNVLCNIDLDIEEGEFVTVMGPSGSGKSTLLYTVSGMDQASSGIVEFEGRSLSSMTRNELTELRLRKMGFIFQQMYMMKNLCIMDNIILPGYQAGMNKKEVDRRAEELMRRLEIIDTASKELTEVSGGQLQRACLCRALINSPKIIFADEPTGALNSKASGDVMRELNTANRDGTTILMVTHSERVASFSNRVIFLMDGGIQGELVLGKLEDDEEITSRERKLHHWLSELGW
ncbi:MAG: Bacitracin export ATP-binding protein BceA [Firmicutes bacterium ADurb.BinA205]|nr:MAG: Bacitracin export ATP-binding protein BceA [Firmicutes bacterium ADurb.BinA205]